MHEVRYTYLLTPVWSSVLRIIFHACYKYIPRWGVITETSYTSWNKENKTLNNALNVKKTSKYRLPALLIKIEMYMNIILLLLCQS